MDKIKEIIQASIHVKQQILDNEEMLSGIIKVVDVIVYSLENKGRIYFCGNGGSAADAQHLAAEFSGRFYTDRKALPAEALHCNSSYLTAVANDYSYDVIYARLIEGIGNSGDVLIGLSTCCTGRPCCFIDLFHQCIRNTFSHFSFLPVTKIKDLSKFMKPSFE